MIFTANVLFSIAQQLQEKRIGCGFSSALLGHVQLLHARSQCANKSVVVSIHLNATSNPTRTRSNGAGVV